MATLVQLASWSRAETSERPAGRLGEVVLFPGVRIEPPDVDLAARLKDAAGKSNIERFGGPAG